jgi:hypothetical protein
MKTATSLGLWSCPTPSSTGRSTCQVEAQGKVSLSSIVKHLKTKQSIYFVRLGIKFSYMHTEKLPQDKFICLTYMKGHQLVSRPSLGSHRRCTRVRLRRRQQHRLFVNYSVRREYSSPGRTDFTSATPCAATTCRPDCTGSTALMPCIRTRCLATQLLVDWLR